MALETIGFAGLIVFGVAFIFCLLCLPRYYKQYPHCLPLLVASLFSLAAVTYLHIIQIVDQGFLVRSDGITIWWPRFVVYAFSFSWITLVVARFMWLTKRATFVAILFTLWIMASLVFATLTRSSAHWWHFGVSVLVFICYSILLWMARRRSKDKRAYYMMWCVELIWIAYLALWVLSPAGTDIIDDLELTWWIYFGLDILVHIILMWTLIKCYVYRKDAMKRQGTVTSLTATATVTHQTSYPAPQQYATPYSTLPPNAMMTPGGGYFIGQENTADSSTQ